MKLEARYIRPQSLTWWAGAMAIGLGASRIAWPDIDPTGELSRVLLLVTGGADASPAGLIALGLGLIGIRDAIAREGR